MTRVVHDISTSLDGFVTDPDGVPEGLHEETFGPPDGSHDGTTAASVPDT